MFSALAILLATATPVPPISEVAEVKIESGWGGLGDPWKESFTLTPAGDGFEGSGEVQIDNHTMNSAKPARSTRSLRPMRFSKADVQDLVSRMIAPKMDRAAAIERIATKEWLATNAPLLYAQRFQDGDKPCSSDATALFIRRFTSPEASRKAFESYFGTMWTDDYPSARVTVSLADGTTLKATSASQKYEMLPWELKGGATWDSTLPKAVSKLLPRDSKLRERLEGDTRSIAREYADQVLPYFDDEWQDLEVRCRQKDLVSRVEARFHVIRVLRPTPDMFAAYLNRPDFPPNLQVYMVISRKSKRETERQMLAFDAKMERYLRLALPYARAHLSQPLVLQFYLGASLDDFDIDIRADPKDAPLLRKVADGVAVLANPDTRKREFWALLPSGDVLHWE